MQLESTYFLSFRSFHMIYVNIIMSAGSKKRSADEAMATDDPNQEHFEETATEYPNQEHSEQTATEEVNRDHVEQTASVEPAHGFFEPRTRPRIILAASGSVAAVKFEVLVHSFIEWADVVAVATETALRFIDRSTLPRNLMLYTDKDEWSTWKIIGDNILHIEMWKWADVMVVAPLSANTLAKIGNGLCDNLLTCVARSWDKSKPFYVAPSMHTYMWNNPITLRNLESIHDLGISLVPPLANRLECGHKGNGAMTEPCDISTVVRLSLMEKKRACGCRWDKLPSYAP